MAAELNNKRAAQTVGLLAAFVATYENLLLPALAEANASSGGNGGGKPAAKTPRAQKAPKLKQQQAETRGKKQKQAAVAVPGSKKAAAGAASKKAAAVAAAGKAAQPAAAAQQPAGTQAAAEKRAAAWLALLSDLDARVKAGRIALSDIAAAVALLPRATQRSLASITTYVPASELPPTALEASDGLAEAYAALAAAAPAAAAAASLPDGTQQFRGSAAPFGGPDAALFRPALNLDGGIAVGSGAASARACLERGLCVEAAAAAGHSAAQLLAGGYAVGSVAAAAGGDRLRQLRAGGVGAKDLIAAWAGGGGPLAGLGGSAAAARLLAAGYTAADCLAGSGGLSTWDVRLARGAGRCGDDGTNASAAAAEAAYLAAGLGGLLTMRPGRDLSALPTATELLLVRQHCKDQGDEQQQQQQPTAAAPRSPRSPSQARGGLGAARRSPSLLSPVASPRGALAASPSQRRGGA